MIAKRILRERGTSSFGRLGRYILREQGRDCAGAMERMADYILDPGGGRSAQARFTNCLSTESGLALKEILATQAMNRRAKGDKTYHLVISFPPGEWPSPQVLADIEDTLCHRIGLGRHQRLSAIHLNTGHLHLHVAINKVHPEIYRSIEPYYDKRRLMQACMELEIKHGLTPTAHGMLSKSQRLPEPAEAALINELKTIVAPQILGPSGPQSWKALHDFLGRYGFELRLRGAGLVFQRPDRTFRVKASVIDRDLSLKALSDRLGPFQPKLVKPPEYMASAIRRQQDGLYQRYLSERAASEHHDHDRGGAQAFELVKASYERQARAILEDRSLTNAGRNAAFRAFRARRQAAFDTLRQNWRRPAPPSFPSWPAYVRAKAALGDVDAIAVFERWRTRSHKARSKTARFAGLEQPAPQTGTAGLDAKPAMSKAGKSAKDPRIAAFSRPSNNRRERATRSRTARRAATR